MADPLIPSADWCFEPTAPEPGTPAPPAAPGIPAVTITDLASFSPDAVTPTVDPFNVGVAGLPANFVANAAVHTRTGTLFGAPVTVRFTPVAYVFDHGDGTTARTRTGGTTWEALGVPQFTPTDTSHVYKERGFYDTSVTVYYTAEIDLGTGFTPIDGELATPGPVLQIRVYKAYTALVQYTCEEDPDGIGC
jgi:rubredoxin